MLKINEREVPISTSFLLTRGESAVFSPKELNGHSVRLTATDETVDFSDQTGGLKLDQAAGVFHVTFPFLPQSAHTFEVDNKIISSEGKVMVRVARIAVGAMMLVHVDISLERKPDYGPRP